MKLKDLKKKLNALPIEMDEHEIILQKDAEGNGYSPLSDIDDEAIYVPDSTYSGDVYILEYSAEDNCMTEEEWKNLKEDKTKRCIVLCPIN